MVHKFGVFNTVEELNLAAAAQKAEGDTEALYALAAENGIDRDEAEFYLEGTVEELTTPIMAAIGKLDLEAAELGLKSQLLDWKCYIASMCAGDDEMCRAVFRPDKELVSVLAEGIRYASQNRTVLPDKITELAGIPKNSAIGMTGRDERRRIAEEYYLGVKRK